ncbi:MAG TPA: TIGR03943 family protein [Anaerovoracaceae bacterium]|nr:TIGR03943 family protein [Anaerovoracaceae bacterium]
MQKRKRVLNPQAGLEFLCYAAFTALILYLVSSGKYQNYVAPKLVPYLYFAAAVMAIWTLSGLFQLFRPQFKTRTAHCFVLAIPIMLLLLPHAPVSASDLSSGYLSGNAIAKLSGQNPFAGAAPSADKSAGANSTPQTSGQESEPQADEQAAEPQAGGQETDIAAAGIDSQAAGPNGDSQAGGQDDVFTDEYGNLLVGLDMEHKKITVKDDYFYPWIAEIYTNLDKYEGYQISITGFVFKDPETMQSDEFTPARLMMSCCVADLTPVGLICNYANASGLEDESWVTVEGTIYEGEYQGEAEPQILVTKISPAEEVEGYVYP